MVRIFIGYDKRQPIAYHVLCHSILRRASVPVSITPLILDTLPIKRQGLTEFTFSRYLVPYLCDYEGIGIFMDSDMLVLGDVAELPATSAVSVVNHQGPLAYERPSVMVFDCGYSACEMLTPEYIENNEPQTFEWAGGYVGELPREWNFLVGYNKWWSSAAPHPKLAHYTQGIPAYKECRNCDFAQEWFDEYQDMKSHCSWIEIMGNSVHAEPVLKRLVG